MTASVCSELINLRAILALPKGTEHFISDLHGESAAVRHILNNCSGVILEKVRRLFEELRGERGLPGALLHNLLPARGARRPARARRAHGRARCATRWRTSACWPRRSRASTRAATCAGRCPPAGSSCSTSCCTSSATRTPTSTAITTRYSTASSPPARPTAS